MIAYTDRLEATNAFRELYPHRAEALSWKEVGNRLREGGFLAEFEEALNLMARREPLPEREAGC
jgi:hypothetical protein